MTRTVRAKSTIAFLQHHIICSIQDGAAIPKGWILLDSHSRVDKFPMKNSNKHL